MASPVIGFKYLFGIHMGISRGPVDELIEIKVADKTTWRGSITANAETAINEPELFGGEKGEGGIVGTLTSMFGGPTQTAHTNLATVLQTPMPGFRRMFTVFFDGVISMMNPYPKPWMFRVRRTLAGWDGTPWYPEKAVVSLVRPVSRGESEGTSESVNVVNSETLVSSQVGPGSPFTVTITPPGPLVSIDKVYTTLSSEGEAGPTYSNYYYVLVTDYTVAGNVITFVDYPPGESTGPFSDVPLTIHVDYTYTLTTINPLGGLGTGLIKAMNPVHILYECITNREWGRGLDSSRLDDPSWRFAADQAFVERFGMCIRWNRRDEIKSFIQLILDHLGATLFDDRSSAKIKIKLIRDDYVKLNLPLFDSDTGLLEISESTVTTLSGAVNEVRVTYRDPVTNEDRTVRASNLAALQSAGGTINAVSKSYPGIPTGDLASRLGKRDLRALSPSIRRFSITLDRRGNNLTPGGVLRIQDLPRSIPDMVLRIGTVDYGKLDDGKIQIQALQDVFGLPQRGFAVINPPQHEPPSTRPCLGENAVFEVPYRSVFRVLTAVELAAVDPAAAYLGVVAEEGQPLNTTYNVAVRPGAPELEDQPPNNSYVCGI